VATAVVIARPMAPPICCHVDRPSAAAMVVLVDQPRDRPHEATGPAREPTAE
jgi:hypothetical protein